MKDNVINPHDVQFKYSNKIPYIILIEMIISIFQVTREREILMSDKFSKKPTHLFVQRNKRVSYFLYGNMYVPYQKSKLITGYEVKPKILFNL